MEYVIGFLGGVAVALTVRALWLEWMPRCGVEKPREPTPTRPKEWAQTRNFLYYDGTVMPTVKEDKNEQ